MHNTHYHIRLPGPLDLERNALHIVYYVLRIVHKAILIVVTLLVLGGLVA